MFVLFLLMVTKSSWFRHSWTVCTHSGFRPLECPRFFKYMGVRQRLKCTALTEREHLQEFRRPDFTSGLKDMSHRYGWLKARRFSLLLLQRSAASHVWQTIWVKQVRTGGQARRIPHNLPCPGTGTGETVLSCAKGESIVLCHSNVFQSTENG